MKKMNKTPLAAAMGTALVTSFTASSVQAETNPFSMTELSDGYMQVAESDGRYTVKPFPKTAKTKEASCGEGQCGAMMDGDKMKKGMENACGAMMKGKEGACGMDMGDMKGGEMSCGAMMEKMKGMKGGDMSCGAMMKGGEGSCGSKVDPEKAAGE